MDSVTIRPNAAGRWTWHAGGKTGESLFYTDAARDARQAARFTVDERDVYCEHCPSVGECIVCGRICGEESC